MKKIYVLIIMMIVFAAITKAQPTFTLSHFPSIGYSTTSYDVSDVMLSPGNAGANQTWNFSGATGTLQANTSTFVDPASTGFGGLFPSSNIAVTTTSSGGNAAYGFYQTTPSAVYLVGAGTNGTPAVMLQYTNPLTGITFPWTYGSTLTDTYTAYATYSVSGINVEIFRTGRVNYVADGYGTLITPTGAYNNCLRQITADSSRDSIIYTGVPLPATITTNNSTAYSYLGPGSIVALFQMVYDTSNTSGTPDMTYSANYTTISTGVIAPAQVKELSIYPNPAISGTEINISTSAFYAGEAVAAIYNIDGRMIKNMKTIVTPGTDLSLDISGLSHGLYTIQFSQNGQLYRTVMIR